MSGVPDFYLTSYDREPPLAPRRCTVLRRLHYGARDDVALVSVDPPFEREAFATQAEVSDVALASRHQGHTLFPVTEWPLHVYVCLPKDRRAP